jgi:hypothetical protein
VQLGQKYVILFWLFTAQISFGADFKTLKPTHMASSLAKGDDPQRFFIHHWEMKPTLFLNSQWLISLVPADASRALKKSTTLM